MVAVPTAQTWVDGEIPTADTLNSRLYEVWSFLLNPPMVKARQTTAQSLATTAYTYLNFQVEEIDTHGFHSSTTPSRFTPTVPGKYVGYVGGSYTANASGRRVVAVRKNGNNIIWRRDVTATIEVSNLVVKGVSFGPVAMNGTTDYLEVGLFQDSGVALSTEVGTAGVTDYEMQCEFYMRWWSV